MQDTGQGCAVLSSQSFNTLYFIRTTLTRNTQTEAAAAQEEGPVKAGVMWLTFHGKQITL